MTGKIPRLALSGVLLTALLVGGSVATVGYIEQSIVSVRLSAPNVVRCDRGATIKARVTSNRTGDPIRGQIVNWAVERAQSSGDGLDATSTLTDRRGRTSVTLTFGPAEGRRTISASAGNTSPTISVRCAGGLPVTSIRLPEDFVVAEAAALLPPAELAVTATSEPPAVGLRMERLGIDLPIVEGDGATVPEGVASHYPGTAWPGEGSNTYLYAHAREGSFLELWQVRTGDELAIDLADGVVVEYRVTEILPVVEWDALEYLHPTQSERVTLQTSLWYEDTAPRFIVIAEPTPGT
jgi:LPXTG-site transpeptidase (sortase) family protein